MRKLRASPLRKPAAPRKRKPRTPPSGTPEVSAAQAASSPRLPSAPAVQLPEVAAPAPLVPPLIRAPAAAAVNELSLRGEYWQISYGGQTGLIEDCRGLRYIAILIRDAAAGKGPIHARELVALASGQTADPIELETPEYVLDATARRELMDRLEEIAAERDRACAADELDRAAALDEEHERIAGELTLAAGSRGGGPGRRGAFSHAGEKARKAVGKAITEAIARIAACPDLPPLAVHLGTSLRKGQWLSYTGPATWEIEFQPPPPRK